MINKINKDFEFIKNFEKIADSFKDSDQPEWLVQRRKESLNRFKELGLPTVKDEEWKYTSVKPMLAQQYALSSKSKLNETQELDEYCGKNDINLVFVNGVFDEKLSSPDHLEDGLTILNLKQA